MTVDSVGDRTKDLLIDSVSYAVYENELQMPDIMKLIQKDLSEPYSIYTYRYFIHNWPHLCYMVRKFYGKLIVSDTHFFVGIFGYLGHQIFILKLSDL